MGALIGGIVSGIASNIGSDWLKSRFNPSSPFDEFIAIFLELLLYPIGVAILYLIALSVASLFSFWIVIAIALVLFVTVVYLKLAYSIYKGKYQFKDAT